MVSRTNKGNYGECSKTTIREFTSYPNSILRFSGVASKEQLHTTQKPVDLLEYLIKTYTNEGDIVLDCFAGSCTTGLAAINTGRNFIGCEIDKEYFTQAQDRIAPHLPKAD